MLSVGYRIAETIPSGWEAIPGTPSPGVASPRKPLPRWVAVLRWGSQLDSQFTAMGGELLAQGWGRLGGAEAGQLQ